MENKAGIMISEIAFANMPVLLKAADLDFFILDCEHGGFDYSQIAGMISVSRLAGISLIIRLADNSRKDIIKFADMGAQAFLLPMTDCAEDIEKVVKYACYSPVGKRGISTMRAHTFYAPPDVETYKRSANDKMKIYAQIETAAGVENTARILGVNGVVGCFIGPNDLSDDYGCLTDKSAAQIYRAIEIAGKAAQKAGKVSGIISGNAGYCAAAEQNGFTMFCKGSELNAIKEYGQRVCQSVKGAR